MTSKTMSANSSDVDVVVGPGAGGWFGSAAAVPIATVDNPMTTTADNSSRIATPIQMTAWFSAKLAPGRLLRTPTATSV
jgi:hypothetical protein